MTVVRVLAEAAVGDDHARIPESLAQRADRLLDDAVVRERSRSLRVLGAGSPKSSTPPRPRPIVSSTVAHSESMLS